MLQLEHLRVEEGLRDAGERPHAEDVVEGGGGRLRDAGERPGARPGSDDLCAVEFVGHPPRQKAEGGKQRRKTERC